MVYMFIYYRLITNEKGVTYAIRERSAFTTK